MTIDANNSWIVSGVSLFSKIKDAVAERAQQAHMFAELESVIDAELIQAWTVEVTQWEADSTQPNPLTPRTKGSSKFYIVDPD